MRATQPPFSQPCLVLWGFSSSRGQGRWLVCSYLTSLLGRQTWGPLLVLPKCKLSHEAKPKPVYKDGAAEMHD